MQVRSGSAGPRLTLPWLVSVCALLALALRAPFLRGDLGSDEAGLLLVVRGWGPGEDRLYGEHWVDRPPLLLAYYWLADLLPGAGGVRLLGCLATVLLVGCAAGTGYLVRGRGGAWAGGVVAAALGSSYPIGGHLANG